MTFLFIEKLLLAWIIVDLLVLCLLVLAKPPVDRARVYHDRAAGIIPRTPCPEANFAERLNQPSLQRLEQPNFQSNEVTDLEPQYRLRTTAINSLQIVQQGQAVISESRDLLGSGSKIHGPSSAKGFEMRDMSGKASPSSFSGGVSGA